jgi:NodT family efflux transporter outer membrane factor (OMF) lipoprotein
MNQNSALKKTLIVFSMTLTACAHEAVDSLPDFDTGKNYKEYSQWIEVTGDQSKLLSNQWWLEFNDEELNTLESSADKDNPELATFWSRISEASAQTKIIESQTHPNLDVFGQSSSNRQSANRPLRGANQPDVYGSNTYGFSLDYDLDLWGRLQNQIKAGQSAQVASQLDYQNALNGLHTEIALHYFELRHLDALISLYQETTHLYENQYSLTRNLHDQGVVSGQDIARSQAQLEIVKEKLYILKADRAKEEHALAILTGQLPSNFSISSQKYSISKLPLLDLNLPSTLLMRRPDIVSAMYQVMAANEEIGYTKKAYFPNILFNATLGLQNTGGVNLLRAPNLLWAIGPSAIFNIYDGGKRKSQIQLSTARRDKVVAVYKQKVLNAFKEVEDSMAYETELEKGLQSAILVNQANQTLFDHTNRRFFEGIDSYFEVTLSSRDLLSSEETLINLKFQKLDARLRFIHALGGGWRNDIH